MSESWRIGLVNKKIKNRMIVLLDEVLENNWSGVFIASAYDNYERGEEWSSHTYVYEKDGEYFKRTWHDNYVNGHWEGFFVHQYWDSEESITQAEYKSSRRGEQLIDTKQKVKTLLRLKRRREKRRRKKEAQRAAEEGPSPECAKCGKKMVKRRGLRREFWVCPSYPDCKDILTVENLSPSSPRDSTTDSSDQSVRKS